MNKFLITILSICFLPYLSNSQNKPQIITQHSNEFSDISITRYFNRQGKETKLIRFRNNGNDTLQIVEHTYDSTGVNEILYKNYSSGSYHDEPFTIKSGGYNKGRRTWSLRIVEPIILLDDNGDTIVSEKFVESDTTFYYYDSKGNKIGDSNGNKIIYEYNGENIRKITDYQTGHKNEWVNEYNKENKISKSIWYRVDTLVQIIKFKYEKDKIIETYFNNFEEKGSEYHIFLNKNGDSYLVEIYDKTGKLTWKTNYDIEYFEENE